MRLRTVLIMLAALGLGLGAAGCFQESNTGQTVTQAITLGVGTEARTVLPQGSTPSSSSTSPGSSTAAETVGTTTPSETAGTTAPTSSATSTGGTSTTLGGVSGNPVLGKEKFVKTCGGCHTLKAAGTSGTVGPDLDQIKPDAPTVLHQIANAAPPMPRNLYTGQDAKDVAVYVASVAGSS